jgi:hypothetical protein
MAYVNQRYSNRWTGRVDSTAWPLRSPDLTPLHFFYVYESKVQKRVELFVSNYERWCLQKRTGSKLLCEPSNAVH